MFKVKKHTKVLIKMAGRELRFYENSTSLCLRRACAHRI